MTPKADGALDGTMDDTLFLFKVGMALGQAMAPKPTPTVLALEPGQRTFQVWSEPDWLGNRQLLTFEIRYPR